MSAPNQPGIQFVRGAEPNKFTDCTIENRPWPPRRCSGPSCNQGRHECQTPDACELPEKSTVTAAGWFWLAYAALLVGAAAAFVLVVTR